MALADYLVVAAYFLVVIYVGLLARRSVRTSDDFFLSGRFLPFSISFLALSTLNCGEKPKARRGSAEYQYGEAKKAISEVKFEKAISLTGEILSRFASTEYADKARILRIVLLSGLSQGYGRMAEAHLDGFEKSIKNAGAFRSIAFDYYRKYRERELRTAELEKRLVQAKLQTLQMQLNPHFLFNTLHSISSLMHKDVEAADKMITRLGDLLRAALAGADTQEVTLRQELNLLQLYLSIEQIRFGNRLSVKMEIAPDTLEAQVPNLILQPLVENAIRHGIEPRARPGCIELRSQRQDSRLALVVSDNGAGISGNGAVKEGVGLSNTRARLRELYGETHRFELVGGPAGGMRVEVSIPFREERLLQ